MVTRTLIKFKTHLYSQWCVLAIKHTIAANVRSSERLTQLYDDMKHDSDKSQNLQKTDNLTKFRNGFLKSIDKCVSRECTFQCIAVERKVSRVE